MEQELLKETISAAKAVRTESEMLSDLLSRGEVLSDARLSAHYEKRRRAAKGVLAALDRWEGDPTDANAELLRRELILLRLEDGAAAPSHAGAGVCVYAQYYNEKQTAFATLAALCSSKGLSVALKEETDAFFRAEAMGEGAHRLFASLAKRELGERVAFSVYPILQQTEVREEDVRTDIFLNGGKGGQNVNKVETAVRMTHVPTGVTVTCRDERSQLQNKKRAARLLRVRVAEYYRLAQDALIAQAKRHLGIDKR